MTRFASLRLAAALPAILFGFGVAHAQSSGPGYFVPHPKAAPAPHPIPAHQAITQSGAAQSPLGAQAGANVMPKQQLPPIPQLPALPKETASPAPVMGVLSVQQVMQQSSAAQGVEKIILQRRQELQKQAQAEGQKFEAQGKAINAEKSKLSKAQLTAREQVLQKQIAQAQVDFHNRNIAIEISARKALGKIEATLIAVIRQVSEAHGMNLVLHRTQVALNTNPFDISKEVAGRLNKILPSVAVPPAVVPKNLGAAPAQK